jgi:hypothetical protein
VSLYHYIDRELKRLHLRKAPHAFKCMRACSSLAISASLSESYDELYFNDQYNDRVMSRGNIPGNGIAKRRE